MSFAERHGLMTPDRLDAALRVERLVQEHGLEVVRVGFPDQHGLIRGKTIMAADVGRAMLDGVSITSSLLAKDTSNKTVFPIWQAGGGFGVAALEGAGDVLMIPTPRRSANCRGPPRTGWLLADIHLADGRPVPVATRHVLRSALGRLAAAGYDYIAGLEVEFHVFKLETTRIDPDDAGQPGAPPAVSILTPGYQYLSELRFDQIEPVVELIRGQILKLGLPLRSVECEYGPSQCEFTFQAQAGLEAADTMVLFRSAVKQICRRNGLHATFMCRPQIPNVMSSGWHLHQSLIDKKTGRNAFMPVRAGRGAVGGGAAFPGRPAAARAGGRTVHDADAQRLQAVPLAIAGARSRGVGPRQPRRDDPRAVGARRSGEPAREPHRRAGGQSLPLSGQPNPGRSRRHGAATRSRPVRRHALRNEGRAAAEEPG